MSDSEHRVLTPEEFQRLIDRDFWMRRVNADLVNFDVTDSSIALWRAYRRIRDAGEPVPEVVLKRLDRLAEQTLKRGSAPLTPKEDAHRYRTTARTIRVLMLYETLNHLHGGRRSTAWLCRGVARDFGMTASAVEKLVRRHRKPAAPAAPAVPRRRNSIFDV